MLKLVLWYSISNNLRAVRFGKIYTNHIHIRVGQLDDPIADRD